MLSIEGCCYQTLECFRLTSPADQFAEHVHISGGVELQVLTDYTRSTIAMLDKNIYVMERGMVELSVVELDAVELNEAVHGAVELVAAVHGVMELGAIMHDAVELNEMVHGAVELVAAEK